MRETIEKQPGIEIVTLGINPDKKRPGSSARGEPGLNNKAEEILAGGVRSSGFR
ncbi:MAG: hypothetical protein WA419_11440 [Silvibacterium sp.]